MTDDERRQGRRGTRRRLRAGDVARSADEPRWRRKLRARKQRDALEKQRWRERLDEETTHSGIPLGASLSLLWWFPVLVVGLVLLVLLLRALR